MSQLDPAAAGQSDAAWIFIHWRLLPYRVPTEASRGLQSGSWQHHQAYFLSLALCTGNMQPGAALADVSNTASRVPPAETPPKTGAGQPDAAAGATQVQQDTCTAAEKQDDTTPNSKPNRPRYRWQSLPLSILAWASVHFALVASALGACGTDPSSALDVAHLCPAGPACCK